MKLEGIEVKHKAFGIGVISEHVENYITITFSQGEKKFIYPDAFKAFIKATDDSVNLEIQKDIENIDAAKKEIEKQATQTIIKEEKRTYTSSKAVISKARNGGKQYFFVFQNKSFDAERRGGYLWAPKSNQDGRKVSHWIMMEEVHKGDIIIHSVNKNIRAISIAISDCYSANQPDELKREQMWEDDGYMIDCQYIDIQYPIVTSDYMDTILELQPAKYAPFNSIGRGNTGYLFASNKELSDFLIGELSVKNKYLKELLIDANSNE